MVHIACLANRELDSQKQVLRSARPGDANDIVTLNLQSVAVTSPMDEQRFLYLLELSSLCIVAEREEGVVGFVLAMRSGAAYDNGNFQWFAERLKSFLYGSRELESGKIASMQERLLS